MRRMIAIVGVLLLASVTAAVERPDVVERSGKGHVPDPSDKNETKWTEVRAHFSEVLRSAKFSPDGRYLITVAPKSVWLFDVKNRTVLREFKTGSTVTAEGIVVERSFTAAMLSPDGRLLVTTEESGEVRFWEVATGGNRGALALGACAIAGFTPDGEFLIVGTRDRIAIVAMSTGKTVRTITASPPCVVSRDGKWVAGITESLDEVRHGIGLPGRPEPPLMRHRYASCFEIASGKSVGRGCLIESRPLNPGGVNILVNVDRMVVGMNPPAPVHLHFMSDGKNLVVCQKDLMTAYSIATGQVEHTVSGCAQSPIGHRIAVRKDFGLRIEDPASGESLDWRCKRDESPLSNVDFSPDGRSVAFTFGIVLVHLTLEN